MCHQGSKGDWQQKDRRREVGQGMGNFSIYGRIGSVVVRDQLELVRKKHLTFEREVGRQLKEKMGNILVV